MTLLPRTLFGRLLLLMATGLITAQLIGVALHLAERHDADAGGVLRRDRGWRTC